MEKREEIRSKLEEAVANYTAKINLWKRVGRLHKKDGSDFKVISKNFENATIYANYMRRNVIKVDDWTKEAGYVSDEMNIWEYVDCYQKAYGHNFNPENHEIIRESAWTREYFYLTVDEIFEAIENRIAMYEKYIAEKKAELEKLDDVFTAFSRAIETAMQELKEKAGDDSSLYYACLEYMQKVY